jgi:hypothetical protein
MMEIAFYHFAAILIYLAASPWPCSESNESTSTCASILTLHSKQHEQEQVKSKQENYSR